LVPLLGGKPKLLVSSSVAWNRKHYQCPHAPLCLPLQFWVPSPEKLTIDRKNHQDQPSVAKALGIYVSRARVPIAFCGLLLIQLSLAFDLALLAAETVLFM